MKNEKLISHEQFLTTKLNKKYEECQKSLEGYNAARVSLGMEAITFDTFLDLVLDSVEKGVTIEK